MLPYLLFCDSLSAFFTFDHGMHGAICPSPTFHYDFPLDNFLLYSINVEQMKNEVKVHYIKSRIRLFSVMLLKRTLTIC